MIYDLPAMIDPGNRRRPILLPMRLPTLAQEQELAAVCAGVAAKWQAALPRVLAAVERRRAFAADADPGADETGSIHGEIAATSVATAAALNLWATRVDAWQQKQWIATVKARSGVGLGLGGDNLLLTRELNDFMDWAASLITSMNDETRNRVTTAIFAGFEARRTPNQVAMDVRRIIGDTRRRALLIARHQSVMLAAKLTEMRHLRAGVTQYVWKHSHLPNARPHHLARDGQIFDWKKPPADGHPGIAINCRCLPIGYIPALR